VAATGPLLFTQYYLECLSQASYLVGDAGTRRAAVVDPRRDVGDYLADADAAGLTIDYVIETHFHADFLSGHLELAAATGAQIVFGPGATTDFAIRNAVDGERISLGDVTLELLSTPGHTPESISIVVWEQPGDVVPFGVLTGDTLFIGDVGRPDLLSSKGTSPDELAQQLYRSIHDKLLRLPDATRVYPGHGAGSACGKQLSSETSSTIGQQRRTNYALAPMSAEQFVDVVTEGQQTAPAYFQFDAGLNRSAHELLDLASPEPLSVDAVLARQATGAVVLDVRDPSAFAAGHLEGSLNVGLHGRFAEYTGSVVDAGQDIVLVTEPGQELEAKLRLGRIGFDRVVGALDAPEAAFVARPEVVVRSSRLNAEQLADRMADLDDLVVLDVRSDGEREYGTIEGAVGVPLSRLRDGLATLDLGRPIVVSCASGFRSMIASSVLAAAGASDVSDLLGGYGAWTAWRDGDATPAGRPSGDQ
jgi:glyoxylase-like metal-dependent hydrolase (beta-lactamase superfamily II)/rhodanese-related sulfurtransferase